MSSEPAAPNLPLFCQPLNRATSGGFFCKFQCIFVVDNCSAPVLLLEEACSWEDLGSNAFAEAIAEKNNMRPPGLQAHVWILAPTLGSGLPTERHEEN